MKKWPASDRNQRPLCLGIGGRLASESVAAFDRNGWPACPGIRNIDRGKQKEVCDFLLVLRGDAVLVSMKSQEDPSSRTKDKLRLWTIKNSTNALKQAKGALRTIADRDFWCQHSRRGRVDFKPNSIRVVHVVVLTEVFNDAVDLPKELPLLLGGVPVSYLSLNDFLNLINELRAFPDITAYLDARRTLPENSRDITESCG